MALIIVKANDAVYELPNACIWTKDPGPYGARDTDLVIRYRDEGEEETTPFDAHYAPPKVIVFREYEALEVFVDGTDARGRSLLLAVFYGAVPEGAMVKLNVPEDA